MDERSIVLDELIRCPNCDSSIPSTLAQCPHCGAKQLSRRVIFGAKREEFTLTPDEEPTELGDQWEDKNWRVSSERRMEPVQPAAPTQEVRWGGFFRRAFAFLLDCVMIILLSAIMFVLSYVGYKVGLSAYGRSVNLQNSPPLFFFITWGWIGLATAYFVVFHGMEGKTIGKWLLGLRVVGEDRGTIRHGRAFLRWVGTLLFAPLVLGFLWVLWSREKRGWHDFLARTWVIRD
jgi:uncharacterized RDD family membrane protein YckC/DNA-directed RNA polymerase subunit RPC12/RpoP